MGAQLACGGPGAHSQAALGVGSVPVASAAIGEKGKGWLGR